MPITAARSQERVAMLQDDQDSIDAPSLDKVLGVNNKAQAREARNYLKFLKNKNKSVLDELEASRKSISSQRQFTPLGS